MRVMPGIISHSDVGFLPIVGAFVKEIGLPEEFDRLCGMDSDVRPGVIASALVMDTLSGRGPLYRLERFVSRLDSELLFGQDVEPSKFNDDAVGRVLDRVAQVGPGKFLTAVAVRTVKLFELDLSHVHHDTTSITLYGDYDLYQDPDHGHPFQITYGFNKDHRPDLKQIVHSLLCVDHGIPIRSKFENGNKSDKTVNEDLLSRIVDVMKKLGRTNFVYVADSALVTPKNLELMGHQDHGCLFVTKLPESYKECGRAIDRAVCADKWMVVGTLSEQPATPKRKPAFYRCYETTVTLYGQTYRALVVHSDALDKRKNKKLTKAVKDDSAELTKIKQEHEKIDYACLPDAQAAVDRLPRGKFHRLNAEIHERIRYARGRPKADGTRKITGITYRLSIEILPDEEAVHHAQLKAGCFVLLSNTLLEGSDAVGSRDLLFAYKDQGYVERNFGFLKDDTIVNSLFLKSPGRLEALGLILVLSLLVWRLMERSMRLSLKQSDSTITGWDKKQTSRPTSFMMKTYFQAIPVVRTEQGRMLGNPLDSIQLDYLRVLGLSPRIFVDHNAGFIKQPVASDASGPSG